MKYLKRAIKTMTVDNLIFNITLYINIEKKVLDDILIRLTRILLLHCKI